MTERFLAIPRAQRLMLYFWICCAMLCANAIAEDVSGTLGAGKPATHAPVLVAGKISPSPQTSPGVVQNIAVASTGAVMVAASSPLPTSATVANLLYADLDSNGAANVTNGAGVALLVPGAGGPATVPGDGTNGLKTQGPLPWSSPLGSAGMMPVAVYAKTLGTLPSAATSDTASFALADPRGRLRVIIDKDSGGSASGDNGVQVQGSIAHDSPVSTSNPIPIAGQARSTTDFTSVTVDDVVRWAMTLEGKGRVVHDASDTTRGLDVKFVQAEAGGSTDVAVKASAGNLYKLYVSNPNTSKAYLSFYNATTASTTVGSTTQLLCFMVPGGDASNDGALELTFDPPISFSTAITYALTTTASGSTAPSSACVINIGYK